MLTRRAFLTMMGGAGLAGAGIVASAKLLPAGTAEGGEPVIRYGEEVCAHCGMVIDDPRFAAAWIGDDAGEMHFDDIGCAALEASKQGIGADTRTFVNDFSTRTWLDAREAAYVVSTAIRTPMAYGIVAVRDQAAAHSLAGKVHGQVARWEERPQYIDQRPVHGGGHRS